MCHLSTLMDWAISITEGDRSVAQLVEHWSPKPKVAGSNPAAPAKSSWYITVTIFVRHQMFELLQRRPSQQL